MKTIRPSGFYLLWVTILSLIGAFGNFVSLLLGNGLTLLCVGIIIFLMLLPVALWTHRIEIDYKTLRFKSGLRQRKISLAEIDHIDITSRGRNRTLTVYPLQHQSPIEMQVDVFGRDEIKKLLNEIKAKNAKIRLVVSSEF